MALSFPLELPPAVFHVRTRRFKLETADISSPTWGGLTQSIDVGRAVWAIQYDLVTLREAEAKAVIAAIAALRGPARPFKAYDPLCRLPISYPNGFAGMTKAGGGSFTGTAVLDSVGEQLDSVTLSGLPASFKLLPGDLMSFTYGTTRRALHSVVQPATANGSGVVTATIEPPVIPGWSAEAEVQLADPWCKARLVKGQPDPQWSANRRCAISIIARQDIRP